MFADSRPSIDIASGAPGLVRSLTLWFLLLPLALAAFILAEVTAASLVDVVNALVYALAAGIALAIARRGTPAIADRALWLAVALFSVLAAMQKIAGAIDGGTAINALSGGWLEALCWGVTGTLIALVCWRRPPITVAFSPVPVPTLVLIGFGLQSVVLGIDLNMAWLSQWLGIDAHRLDNLMALVVFCYLQLYLLALVMLAAELTGRHALGEQVAAAESAAAGTATIQAAHFAFATATLITRQFSPRRRRQAVMALSQSSGIGGWIGAIMHTRRLGGLVRAQAGKTRLRQFLEQLTLMHRHRLAPKYYYMFELWRPDHARNAEHYLQRGETKGAAYKLLRGTGADEQRLSEKFEFYKRCRSLGLRTAPIYFSAVAGEADPAFDPSAVWPAGDLFIKPRKGSGGKGASRWRYEAGPVIGYRGKDGQLMSPQMLRDEVLENSREAHLIVQPSLVNHPDLADINCGALATVRFVTCRNEAGGFEATCAAFRMPRVTNSVVDNFHAGGIASAVDIATGMLGPATDMGLSRETAWFTAHPVTGATIAGRVLPCWPALCALAEQAHGHFDDFAVIGWDIAILADGPCIIEANGAPDLDIIQRTSRQPLGNQRLGELISWHLKHRLRAALIT